MKEEDKRVAEEILNVNYAGEYGACNLYKSQIFIAKIFHKDLLEMLFQIEKDEILHCKIFKHEMKKYNMVPCRLTWIWGVAGLMLGFATALLGKRALLLGVSAAEITAHRHLESQIHFLKNRDNDLSKVIFDVNVHEKNHSTLADEQLAEKGLSNLEKIFHETLCKICNLTMWVVTRGESKKLDKFLENNMKI
ncbi:MAG: demethoxyubiquinone hydroxylase family protein [Cocleimonas sp.]|nr:demethoxyubiquinone hydroxylase family protein [Cocleimonas sp.]